MSVDERRHETTGEITTGVLTIEMSVDDCLSPRHWFELMDTLRTKATELGMRPRTTATSFTSSATARRFG